MKYVVMICRGHIPIIGVGKSALKVNRDVEPFIRYFLPKGEVLNRANMSKVVRHFHLAFKDMNTGEVYDILMEQLATLNGYDPEYKDKVKLAVEAINELSKQQQFSAADVNRHLEFDCARHLRLLARSGFLEMVPGREEKGLSDYIRLAAWPPPGDFFEGPPIGVAYYVQRWFRYGLHEWINRRIRMCELESKEGVYSLEGGHRFQITHADGSDRECSGREPLHIPDGDEGFRGHKGRNLAADVSINKKRSIRRCLPEGTQF